MPLRYPKLYAAAFLIFCMAMPFAPTALAKGRKGRSLSSAAGKVFSRGSSKYSRRGRVTAQRFAPADADASVVPDEIEVLENGSASNSDLARLLNPPRPQALQATFAEPDLNGSLKRKPVRIDPRRVIQIQQALESQGFYKGEMSGVYDDNTAEAMRQFQAANKIAATGYPTAQALRRLGLTSY